jgi:hypothetical protein
MQRRPGGSMTSRTFRADQSKWLVTVWLPNAKLSREGAGLESCPGVER